MASRTVVKAAHDSSTAGCPHAFGTHRDADSLGDKASDDRRGRQQTTVDGVGLFRQPKDREAAAQGAVLVAWGVKGSSVQIRPSLQGETAGGEAGPKHRASLFRLSGDHDRSSWRPLALLDHRSSLKRPAGMPAESFALCIKAVLNGPRAPPPGRAPAAAAVALRPSRLTPGGWRGQRRPRRAAVERQTVDRWCYGPAAGWPRGQHPRGVGERTPAASASWRRSRGCGYCLRRGRNGSRVAGSPPAHRGAAKCSRTGWLGAARRGGPTGIVEV
ncbi:hypothetical protein GA0074695_4156 [Micromonospora viridifaciens]|uniref:Uncharacterized protein n=1 Tax=Micromonospora viridifaciens TaxID=1881 RepID=A0A1C4YDQ4_MICVI|nr:hypothetical protein GA0074695_4156 [Micromonospora viridifaciens]